MATVEEVSSLRRRLEQYEGRVAHMYLDSNGFVTVGIGHLLTSIHLAQKIPFKNYSGKMASGAEIKIDFLSVKKQPANRIHSFYKKSTRLFLENSDIDKLLLMHIEAFERELKLIYPGFGEFPSEARMALFDIIFNIGMTDLKNKWPKFNAAVAQRNWQAAAENSGRKSPVSTERNLYVRRLFEMAAKKVPGATASAGV